MKECSSVDRMEEESKEQEVRENTSFFFSLNHQDKEGQGLKSNGNEKKNTSWQRQIKGNSMKEDNSWHQRKWNSWPETN